MYEDLIKIDEVFPEIRSLQDILRLICFLSDEVVACEKIDGMNRSAGCPGFCPKTSESNKKKKINTANRCSDCQRERRKILDRDRKQKKRLAERRVRRAKKFLVAREKLKSITKKYDTLSKQVI